VPNQGCACAGCSSADGFSSTISHHPSPSGIPSHIAAHLAASRALAAWDEEGLPLIAGAEEEGSIAGGGGGNSGPGGGRGSSGPGASAGGTSPAEGGPSPSASGVLVKSTEMCALIPWAAPSLPRVKTTDPKAGSAGPSRLAPLTSTTCSARRGATPARRWQKWQQQW
jgi:hypothetical protein